MARMTFIVVMLALCSCAAHGPNFRAMSPAELVAHNAGLAEWDQIVCVKSNTPGYIKRTDCLSRRDLQLRDMRVVQRVNSAFVDNRVSIDAY